MDGKRRKTISITSGKGGVGKSSIVSNMAYLLDTMNEITYIVDADLALGNIDIMFGIVPTHNIKDFIDGKKDLFEIITRGPNGIRIIPATTGAYELSNLSDSEKNVLLSGIRSIPEYDFIIVDTQAGLSSNVIYFNSICEEMFLIVTPDPASLADSYAVIKVVSKKTGRKKFNVIVNMVKNEAEALDIYRKLLSVTDRFLRVYIEFYGYIPLDKNVALATRRQRLWTKDYPDTLATSALKDICLRLLRS